MAASRLAKWFPWTVTPVICNGPMLNVSCAKLAAEVTKAGGIGFLPSSVNLGTNQSEGIQKLEADLTESRSLLNAAATGQLPVGISFITGHESIVKFSETALPVIDKHKPAIVWLFAPDAAVKPHREIIKALKTLEVPPKVFVQVGNVSAAREAVQDGADAIVCQGIDAGGHQFRRGMGVVSFVPEARRMLEDEFTDRDVAVLGAGGVVNGKGVAALLALGVDGIVMGTRFTVADESIYPDFRKQLVLKTVDGGSSTLKSPFNDQITKSALWGPLYDGRAIISTIHEKFLSGSSLEECQTELGEHLPEDSKKLVSTWAGTGVGLVTKAQPAGDIVKEVREEAKDTIKKLAGLV